MVAGGVSRRQPMIRRSIALFVLCAQASAAAHLLLAQHTVSGSGVVVDEQKACTQGHHGGAGVGHGHAVEQKDVECAAAALARSFGQARMPVPVIVPVASEVLPVAVETGRQGTSLDILSVAPKCSPPV